VETSEERLTAFGNQLVNVHLWLREELAALREGGTLPRDLRAHCLTFCSALERHHTSEEGDAFGELAEHVPELRPVLEELRRDHRIVEECLRRLEALDDPAAIRGELDGLAALLETHFTYEERRIAAALNALDVPAWRRTRPGFLRCDPGDG
jgi:hypothetical protein